MASDAVMTLRTIWLCGDNECRTELRPHPNRDARVCPKCGREHDAWYEYEMNWRHEWK